MQKYDLAVIIVTFNSSGQIETCLDSIFREMRHPNTQVIVVDNASSDETVGIIRSRFHEVELVLSQRNLGFAAGVNLGVKHADAYHILLLNPDTIVFDHAIDRILEFAQANPECGIYGGRTFRSDGKLEPSSCWNAPSLWSMALFAVGISSIFQRNRWLDPESIGKWPRNTVRKVGFITGCFLLCSKAVWDRLDGLDERFFMYGEDLDFCIRASKLGFSPTVFPEAKLIHEVGQSSENPISKSLLLYRGKASMLRIHWKQPRRQLGLVFLVVGTGTRACFSRIKNLIIPIRTPCQWQTLWKLREEWIYGYEPLRHQCEVHDQYCNSHLQPEGKSTQASE
jgi:hypothetical protein